MGELNFTAEEEAFADRVLGRGLLQKDEPKWRAMRLALAASLKLPGDPDEADFGRVVGKPAMELHLAQVVGEGGRGASGDGDLGDPFRFLLSMRHGADYFADRPAYIAMLNRHLRRGLAHLRTSWREGSDFHDYLLDDLYFEGSGTTSPEQGGAGAIGRDALSEGLKQIGVAATFDQEAREGPRLTRFNLALQSVEDYDRLRKGLDDLAFAMGLGESAMTLTRSTGERRVLLDVPRPMASWRTVRWSDLRARLDGRTETLPVCVGTDVMGEPFFLDLAEAPHLFVGGTTGSGKSVCLNAVILSILGAARAPQLVLIDPKAVDFASYDGCRALRTGSVTSDVGAVSDILDDLVEEMEGRQKAFRELGARTLAEAQAAGSDLRRIVVVVDELADLLMQRRNLDLPLARLAQKSRAAGIHLVLATQRPDAATFPGLLRSNIPSRIALTVQKAADSRIILDEGGAENLLMRGDMLVKMSGREARRAHGALIEQADIAAAVGRAR